MNWFKISQSEQSEKTYVVQKGDTLSSISKKLLNNINRWPEIQVLNNIKDPSIIKPGQILKIPSVKLEETSKPVQKTPIVSQSGALEALKKEISRIEGSYGAYNRGTAGDTSVPQIDIS